MRRLNLSLPGLRAHLPTVAAVVIGLAVALLSTKYMLGYVNTHRETVRVPVLVRDVAPYTVISAEDVGWREIVKGGEEPGAARDPSEVIGKLALSALYKDEQISKERLGDPSLVAGRQIISLNVDVTRSVGGWLRAGDLVDIWWVSDAGQPGAGWSLAATDAVVLDVRDSAGRSVIPRAVPVQQLIAGAPQAQPANPPAVAVLAVKNEDVPRVVGGASPKSQNIVLTKKFAQGGSPLPVQAPAQQQVQQTNPQQEVVKNEQGKQAAAKGR